MARGAEGDCPEQRPKSKKRKRARALKLWFFSLFLCCVKAPVEDTVEVGMIPQKIHGVPNTTTTATPDNPQKALTRQEIRRRVKVGKARWEEQRRKKKRAWYSRLLPKLKMPKLKLLIIPKITSIPKANKFVKKTVKPPKMKKIQDDSTTTRPHIDDCATKGNQSPKEKSAPHYQDDWPKEPTATPNTTKAESEACPGIVVEKMKKDPKRLIDHTDLEKTLKAMEAVANLATRTELPQMPERSKRVVTFEEATKVCSKVVTKKQTKKDLEWHSEATQGCNTVVARRKQTKRDLESHPALPRAWRNQIRRAAKSNVDPKCLAFQKRSFDFNKSLSQLLVVIMMLMIFAWFFASSSGENGYSSNSSN
ncbi:uncharacterized protein LOC134434972 [Engraulis encrasicolus]|uniref:uncharacterized protein LOC134434972 n=1 Tax=Engraulis encrasicolus TaxID=184585 RepID=UPI002FD4F82F